MKKRLYAIIFDCQNKSEIVEMEEELKKSKGWWSYLERAWLIFTDESPTEIWERIEEKVDKKNSLLIIEITNNYQGWLPKDAWDWIKEKFGEIDE